MTTTTLAISIDEFMEFSGASWEEVLRTLRTMEEAGVMKRVSGNEESRCYIIDLEAIKRLAERAKR